MSIYDRADAIEVIVRNKYLNEETDAVDLALDELNNNPSRTDEEIAHVVAMRIAQP